jgi:hypothetical protein
MDKTSIAKSKLMKAFPCNINNGVRDGDRNLLAMAANIYVYNILSTAAF